VQKLHYIILLSLLLIILQYSLCNAQTKKIDSLKVALSNSRDDTCKIQILNSLAWQLREVKVDTSIFLCDQAIRLSETLKSSTDAAFVKAAKNAMVVSYGSMGLCYTFKSDYAQSLAFYFKALKIAEDLADKNKIATQLLNIGNAYFNQSKFPEALEYYFFNLKTREELGQKNKIGTPLGNIGIVYRNQGNYEKALTYFVKALKIEEEYGNKKGIARNMGNIGNAYSAMADKFSTIGDTARANLYYTKALDNYFNTVKMAKEFENKGILSTTLLNIANIYSDQANYAPKKRNAEFIKERRSKALETYFEALKMTENIGDKGEITTILSHIGSLYTERGKYSEACKYLNRALAMSTEIGALNEQKFNYLYLSTLYELSSVNLPDTIGGKILNMEEMSLRSLYYFKMYKTLRDTIFSEENKKELVRKEMNFDFEKKQAATKAEQEKKDIIAGEELKLKENQRNYFIAGFAFVAILALFILKSYRQKQKDNFIITEQKKMVEEKQKEILDSIYYAKKIQSASLPNEKYITKNLIRLTKNFK